jgi:hypothetical protein
MVCHHSGEVEKVLAIAPHLLNRMLTGPSRHTWNVNEFRVTLEGVSR